MKRLLPILLLSALLFGCGGSGGPHLPSLAGTWTASTFDGQPIGYLPGEYWTLTFSRTEYSWAINSPDAGVVNYTQNGKYQQREAEITFVAETVSGTMPDWGNLIPAPYIDSYSIEGNVLTLISGGHSLGFVKTRGLQVSPAQKTDMLAGALKVWSEAQRPR